MVLHAAAPHALRPPLRAVRSIDDVGQDNARIRPTSNAQDVPLPVRSCGDVGGSAGGAEAERRADATLAGSPIFLRESAIDASLGTSLRRISFDCLLKRLRSSFGRHVHTEFANIEKWLFAASESLLPERKRLLW